MRRIITSLVLLTGIVGYAQNTPPTGRVGINTTTPRGTLEIVAPRDASNNLLKSDNHGIVVPSLTKAEVASLTNPVNGTLVFIKDASGTASTTKSNTTNVLGNGFYYYVATGENEGTWADAGTTYDKLQNSEYANSQSLKKSGINIGLGLEAIKTVNNNKTITEGTNDGVIIPNGSIIKSEFVDKITENNKTGYRVLGTNGEINAKNYGNIGTNAIDLSISDTASADAYVAATASTPEQGAYGALGNRSFAAGFESLANAEKSVAIGYKSKALGEDAIALGRYATASGGQSAALGNGATASNQYAFAVGKSVTASGNSSTAIGNEATASGEASFAVGKKVTASGAYSFVAGNTSTASAEGAVAIGENLTASNTNATVLGTYNKVTDTDEIFSVGNGTSSAQKNALVVNGSGTDIKLGIGLGANKGTQAIDANGTARLRNIPAVDNTAVNSLVYADADGVLRKGGSFPKMRVVQFSVVGDLDWVSNFDTKIDATKYDVSILSANLLGARTAAPDGAVIYPEIRSFSQGGTWRLYADIKQYGTIDRKNGTWFFVVLVAPAGSIDYYITDTVVEPAGSSKGVLKAPF